MAVQKKNLLHLVEELLNGGTGLLINGECCEDGYPEAMESDTNLAREIVLAIMRRTTLAEINEIVGKRRLHFDHEPYKPKEKTSGNVA